MIWSETKATCRCCERRWAGYVRKFDVVIGAVAVWIGLERADGRYHVSVWQTSLYYRITSHYSRLDSAKRAGEREWRRTYWKRARQK